MFNLTGRQRNANKRSSLLKTGILIHCLFGGRGDSMKVYSLLERHIHYLNFKSHISLNYGLPR